MTEVSDVCSSSACLIDVNRNGSHKDRDRTTCILSIDGGGIRGIIPTSILIFLEEQLQLLDGEHVRLADYFDLMAGTSTGGLIAGILSVPNEEGRPKFEANDVMKIYFEQGPIIFKKSFVPFLKQIRGPKYSATPLEGILQENLKELRMKDTLSEILIPTFDIKLMQPTYFSTREARNDESKNAYVRDVLRGTSAAPTYFPPHLFKTISENGTERNFHLVDGGVGINNPTHLAIFHSLYHHRKQPITNCNHNYLGEGCKDLLVLSLGTGKVTKSYDANISRNWGLISWVFNDFHAPIIEIVSECSNDVVDYNISSFFKASGNHFNYLRVQAYNIQSDIEALDNTVNTNMKKLREIGERLLDVPLSRMDIETGRPITLQGEMSNKDALIR
ncbi:hypothetical protein KP509_34G034000 [Ceratopteris richardii]|nr:hypothetical protein KP509_34G034000 [Ceratopteris richardii]KAH7283986.1 hypothetical protein KP509_34G034000 [Ceratopteris richardii]